MSRGFSLIEALVALVVLSVGLLGAAALLLGGVRDQSLAVRQGAALALVADIAGRIRANPAARERYDSRASRESIADCAEATACDAADLAALDIAHFETAARALLPAQRPQPQVLFEPAIGPAATDRYVISLTWSDTRDPNETGEARLILLAQPVAGAT